MSHPRRQEYDTCSVHSFLLTVVWACIGYEPVKCTYSLFPYCVHALEKLLIIFVSGVFVIRLPEKEGPFKNVFKLWPKIIFKANAKEINKYYIVSSTLFLNPSINCWNFSGIRPFCPFVCLCFRKITKFKNIFLH